MNTVRCTLVAMAALTGWPTLFLGQEDSKAAVPSAEAHSKALASVWEVYRAERDKAKTAKDKEAFATKLLEIGRHTENLADRYALLFVARDLSVEAGGPTCLRAVDEMAKTYQIDGAAMKAKAIAACSSSARTSEQARVIAQAGIELIDQAIINDAFPLPELLEKATLSAAQKSRDRELVTRVVALNAKVAEVAQAAAKMKTSLNLLGKNAADPAANLDVGKYRCFLKGEWGKGLPMLALGGDPTIKALAEKELQKELTPDEQVAVGDGWWALAEKERGTSKQTIQSHAAGWYRRALPKLTGLVKARVEKRIGTTPAETRPVTSAEPTEAKNTALKGRLAKIQIMQGGEFVPLQPDVPVTNEGRFLNWSKIPPEFKGFYFLRNKEYQGTTKFQIMSPGTVLMVVTTRWGGGGNASGGWQKEIVTQKDLEAEGWRETGKLDSYWKENRSSQGWIVFARDCKNGESFSYRTEKYLAPVLLLK